MHSDIAESALERAIATVLDDAPQSEPDTVVFDVVTLADRGLRMPMEADDDE